MTIPVGISKGQRTAGWVAVALSTLVASFVGMFAGGEGVSEGYGLPAALMHSAQMFMVILPAVVAVRWGRVGGSLLMLIGLGLVLMFAPAALTAGAGSGVLNPAPLLLALFLIVAGVLYFYGRPSPRKVAYAVVIGVPVLVAVLTAILVRISILS